MSDLNEQLAALKAAAEAATPGPWGTTEYYADNGEYEGLRLYGDEGSSIIEGEGAMGDNDARFIAAANPAAILALIAEVEAARRAPAAAPAPVAAIDNLISAVNEALTFGLDNPNYNTGRTPRGLIADALAALAPVPAAAPVVQPVGDYVLMPRRLTAENGAKGALSGEFKESTTVTCHECGGSGEDDEGVDDANCPECNGNGTVEQDVPVTWDTIKRIYKAAVELLAAPASSTAEAKDAARLLAALRKYGTHLHTCECVDGGEIDPSLEEYCNCGLNELLEGRAAIASSADEVKGGGNG